ncbi:hypothetical protein [Gulosibacter hominis]|uniref:hypothetical protein n=1 Tax=Gulosibacter hominis TaxID=2770504 RepID=UPI0019181F59|nr:hypothetical protein [Gulosibacter hominis]
MALNTLRILLSISGHSGPPVGGRKWCRYTTAGPVFGHRNLQLNGYFTNSEKKVQ